MLVLVGFNHASAPLGFRERLAFPEEELPAALGRLLGSEPFEEGLILSTCNRVEVLALAQRGSGGPSTLKDFLALERGVSAEEIDRYSYHYTGRDAVRHLFHVASGLDSMILGEPQILGQVKRAYATAQAAGTTGTILERLLQQGLSVAKRVRAETGISRNAVSVAFAAVELAKKIFDPLRGRTALLLGAGKMTELAAKHLVASGVGEVIVSSRTYNRAVVFAEKIGGSVVNWDVAFSHLARVDIVVSGTAAPEPILGRAQVRAAMRARKGRPLFLIDMAVPRDIEPSVNELAGVYLYDIDDLQGVVDSNLDERHREAEIARRLIEGEVGAFESWRNSLEIKPTIVALRETLLAAGRHELARHRRRLGLLSVEQERAVEEMVRALIQKILHHPIHHLKSSVERGDTERCAALYRDVFGIPEERAPTDAAGGEDDATGERPAGPTRLVPGGRKD